MSGKLAWPARYVGLHFVDGGRDRAGVDCWGLVRLVLKQECAIEVPTYGEISALDLTAIAGKVGNESALDPWVNVVGELRPFDVVVMHKQRVPVHIGIMVSSTEVLHVEKKISAVMVPITHHSIAMRKPSFFRHRDLINAA